MKGAYILLIRLERDAIIEVGALGKIDFKAGTYCYVGSAYGSGGIKARIARHMRKEKKIRWHIDYLLKYGRIERVLIKENGDEVDTASFLSDSYDSVPGFGASDSPLKSHLFICHDIGPIIEIGFIPYL